MGSHVDSGEDESGGRGLVLWGHVRNRVAQPDMQGGNRGPMTLGKAGDLLTRLDRANEAIREGLDRLAEPKDDSGGQRPEGKALGTKPDVRLASAKGGEEAAAVNKLGAGQSLHGWPFVSPRVAVTKRVWTLALPHAMTIDRK